MVEHHYLKSTIPITGIKNTASVKKKNSGEDKVLLCKTLGFNALRHQQVWCNIMMVLIAEDEDNTEDEDNPDESASRSLQW